MKRRRQRKQARRPMSLRHETKRQVIARLLLLGWTAERIAKHLGCTARAVRYAVAKPKLQELVLALQNVARSQAGR